MRKLKYLKSFEVNGTLTQLYGQIKHPHTVSSWNMTADTCWSVIV